MGRGPVDNPSCAVTGRKNRLINGTNVGELTDARVINASGETSCVPMKSKRSAMIRLQSILTATESSTWTSHRAAGRSVWRSQLLNSSRTCSFAKPRSLSGILGPLLGQKPRLSISSAHDIRQLPAETTTARSLRACRFDPRLAPRCSGASSGSCDKCELLWGGRGSVAFHSKYHSHSLC
jgi:hypothetical protein